MNSLGAAHLCSTHSDALASFRCEGCGQFLCYDCVEEGKHLTICGLCGERAELLVESTAVAGPAADPPQPSSPAAATMYQEREAPASANSDLSEQPLSLVVNHIVIPAATIAMVTSLLFFLLDVRSVFLGGTKALKWVGFWFAMATVLIARYGKTSSNEERQGCYTFGLALATIAVIMVSPWESPTAGMAGPLFNTVIILVIWRFATAVTRSLSLEGEDWQWRRPQLYGLERLAMEEWKRQRGEGPSARRKEKLKKKAAAARKGNPSAAVARLAVGGLFVFALGEPVLLSAAPEVGERGLAMMIAFLLATGVVLGAGSAIETLRRVREGGGEVPVTTLPGRVVMSGVLMMVILAVALTVPGIEYRGKGTLKTNVDLQGTYDPQSREQGEVEERSGDDPGKEGVENASDEGESSEAADGQESGGEPSGKSKFSKGETGEPAESRQSGESQTWTASSPLVGFMSSLGKWLRIPFFLGLLVLGIYAVWRLWPLLAGWRGRLKEGAQSLLRRLAALFRRRQPRKQAPRGDPLKNLGALESLSPHEAVMSAYTRLLDFFEQLGHPRPERMTPYEFRSTLPPSLKSFATPLDLLTETYVKAAYSEEAVDDRDREGAIAALRKLKQLTREASSV